MRYLKWLDAGAAGLRGGRFHRQCAVKPRSARAWFAARVARQPRQIIDGGAVFWHHHQPVPVLLAGARRWKTCGRARTRQKRISDDAARVICGASAGTLCRHGLLQPHRILHHLSAAATLHRAGVTDIQTSAQAAEALRPLAYFAFLLFRPGHHRHRHAGGACVPVPPPMPWWNVSTGRAVSMKAA